MSIITKITTQKKRTDRYNIFIDESYAFSVAEDVLLKFELKKGKELDSLLLSQIRFQDDIQKAFTSALGYLAYRMRSETEVRLFLKKKEIEELMMNEVIDKLYSYQYLNDVEFAEAYVRTHANGGNKGPITLRMELKEKGINETLIEKALIEYPFDVQVKHAKQLAEKMIKKERNSSERELKQKLEKMLSRKGFTRDCLVLALREVTIEKDEDEEWDSLTVHAEKIIRRYRAYEGFPFQQKVKEALYRKGFPLELINRYLSERKE